MKRHVMVFEVTHTLHSTDKEQILMRFNNHRKTWVEGRSFILEWAHLLPSTTFRKFCEHSDTLPDGQATSDLHFLTLCNIVVMSKTSITLPKLLFNGNNLLNLIRVYLITPFAWKMKVVCLFAVRMIFLGSVSNKRLLGRGISHR